ncbi:hypothetical protein M1373_01400 [Candidatus Marsarchaeota archaeon]|nr:hypothetical protein [Candidatus Marsarchaeota archaeon]MCL5404954.1 hypothetical protein [Candidatus Marsarchaeota archaeon]
MPLNILLKGKQTSIILLLKDRSKDWDIGELAKASSSTYVHSCNFIKLCEDAGIVSSERHGKGKLIRLTDKGMAIAQHIENIYSLLNQQEDQVRTTG